MENRQGGKVFIHFVTWNSNLTLNKSTKLCSLPRRVLNHKSKRENVKGKLCKNGKDIIAPYPFLFCLFPFRFLGTSFFPNCVVEQPHANQCRFFFLFVFSLMATVSRKEGLNWGVKQLSAVRIQLNQWVIFDLLSTMSTQLIFGAMGESYS